MPESDDGIMWSHSTAGVRRSPGLCCKSVDDVINGYTATTKKQQKTGQRESREAGKQDSGKAGKQGSGKAGKQGIREAGRREGGKLSRRAANRQATRARRLSRSLAGSVRGQAAVATRLRPGQGAAHV